MKIRLPDELKQRIEEAADAAKRSLNAEIVDRLEQSFTARQDQSAQAVLHFLEESLTRAEANVSIFDMRIELAKSRMDNLDVRRRLIAADTERLTKAAMTDEDLALAQESVEQFDAVMREASTIGRELEDLLRDRTDALQRLERIRFNLRGYRKAVEQSGEIVDAAPTASESTRVPAQSEQPPTQPAAPKAKRMTLRRQLK